MEYIKKISRRADDTAIILVPRKVKKIWDKGGYNHVKMIVSEDQKTLTVSVLE